MTLVQKAGFFIENLFKDKLSPAFLYHNYKHTQEVVANAEILANAENLTDDEKEILLVACWFHDSGYTEDIMQHEEKSCEIADHFLRTEGTNEDFIQKVKELIMSTKMCCKPGNRIENIIRDADSSHLASEDYFTYSDNLRKEWEQTLGKNFSKKKWNLDNLRFFRFHQFNTNYAKQNWNPIKEKNLQKIENMLQEQENIKKDKNKKEPKKEAKADRSIDTMFRITLSNHTRLSDIADSKANILLSVNAIIISIALSTLLPKLGSEKNEYLVMPTFIMLLFSVITIIFAILSTKPKVTSGEFTKEDLKNRKVNLLFFGNFYKMNLDDYTPAVREMMEDRDYLYDSMIRDLYYLGVVLNRKYRLLSITYQIFMVGIIVSVIAFVFAFWTS
ncbi:HD domain-containing protein [Elizabethkingia anophelis]|uniref:Pycsar system effector family protein n=1 Tax=Elizabethkingia TaxID=308865 RepID=UPI0007399388|nr:MULTISPECIES: Pycsar system effector family protein [Elizabethkingia]KUF44838.1 phosphohydrolase [Elizabethkingia anophelis]MCT3642591.1 HD domain-containing protein [Elizabethkingia anophelis]MCT3651817.1 HD domain-containing protein [Elizabethkingia anophelis]MCT3655856.1 HD domain-containing protein [Elizabethkingia anophelis]MCT3659162.1 HD domain-containing protein [Elizabethkingia anophelis]